MIEGAWAAAALLLAVSAAIAAVGLSSAHLRRVGARPSPGVDRLLVALRRVPIAERARLAERTAQPGSWEAELAAEVARSRSGEELAAEIDMALADLEAGLVGARGWSAAAMRVGLLGGLLAAAVAAMDGVLLAALAAAAVGGVGAVAAAALGRRAGAAELDQRRRADDLVGLLVGGRAGGAPPGRRTSAAGAPRGGGTSAAGGAPGTGRSPPQDAGRRGVERPVLDRPRGDG